MRLVVVIVREGRDEKQRAVVGEAQLLCFTSGEACKSASLWVKTRE